MLPDATAARDAGTDAGHADASHTDAASAPDSGATIVSDHGCSCTAVGGRGRTQVGGLLHAIRLVLGLV